MNKLMGIFMVMIIMLFIFSHSLAYYDFYTVGNNNTISISSLENIATVMPSKLGADGVAVYATLAVESFEESGLYDISAFVGGATCEFVVAQESEINQLGNEWNQFNLNGVEKELAILPVATLVQTDKDGNTTTISSVSGTNSKQNTMVYVEAGKPLYIMFIANDGELIGLNGMNVSSSVDAVLKPVAVPEGAEVRNTNISSANYTAPSTIGKPLTTLQQNGDEIILNFDEGRNVEGIQTMTKEELEKLDPNINSSIQNAQEEENEEYNASAFEKMLAWFVTKGVGDNIRKAFTMALGENVSIDDLLFNHYANTRLSIFGANRNSNEMNGYLETSGMLDNGSNQGIITKYFMLFRNIAIVCYLVILLYMGVRILMASTGSKKSKYKSMIMDWVVGIIILAFFPYVMKYIIVANNAIVMYVEDLKDEIPNTISLPTIQGISDQEALAFGVVNAEFAQANGDLMGMMRAKALLTGKLAYAMLYVFLIKELLGFIFIYFKRLVTVIFLITIFPLVTISYAVDKIGDGKSQAFNRWTKEFILNVFLQAFQAVNYVVVMSVIFALAGSDGTVNIIFTLIGLSYISKGDELLRGMFTKMSGGGAGTAPKSLSEAVKTVATVGLAKDVAKKVGTIGSRFKTVGKNISNVRDSMQDYQLAKLNQENRNLRIEEERRRQDPTTSENMDINNVEENIAIAFNLSGARNPEEVKEALDRLSILRHDPNRRYIFEAEYNNLSASDKEKLNHLMAKNEALNHAINQNRGLNGKLTEREINLNVSIISDILDGGDSGEYRDLYRFIENSQLTDGAGNVVGTLKDALESQQKGRVLDLEDQVRLKKAQNMFGNVAGIATSNRVLATVNQNTGRVEGTKDGRGMDMSRRHTSTSARLYTMTESEKDSLASERVRILKNAGIDLTNPKVTANARSLAAVDAIATVKEYQNRISSGRQDGISATEGMELATRLKKLKKESFEAKDKDTQRVIKQFEKEVGFNLEEFETSAAVTAIVDWQNLEGTEADKQDTLNEAYQIVQRVKAKSKDAAALATVNRAEIDRVLEGKIKIGMKPIDNGQTEEEYRTSETIEKLRKEIRKEYKDTDEKTVGETRAKLLKNMGELGTSVVSAGAGIVGASVAPGIASAAFYAGASGDINPTNLLGAADVGMSVEHAIEGAVPGTAYANKNTVGGKIDKSIDKTIDKHLKITESTRQADLQARIAKNHSAKKKIESYKDYLNYLKPKE